MWRQLCYALAIWLNNSFSEVMSRSLSSKSAANTLRLSYLREESVSTRTLTISLGSEIYDTTDVGRLTSPLFSQELEVSAAPFGASCSQTHSSMEKSRRFDEPFSSFGKPLWKGSRTRDLWSVQDSQMEREGILWKGS